MSEKVVIALRDGQAVGNPFEPDEVTIKAIEWLVNAAASGEINGICYSCHFSDGTTNSHYAGRFSRGSIGALFSLMNRMSKDIGD